jgi:hypothetical protein
MEKMHIEKEFVHFGVDIPVVHSEDLLVYRYNVGIMINLMKINTGQCSLYCRV